MSQTVLPEDKKKPKFTIKKNDKGEWEVTDAPVATVESAFLADPVFMAFSPAQAAAWAKSKPSDGLERLAYLVAILKDIAIANAS